MSSHLNANRNQPHPSDSINPPPLPPAFEEIVYQRLLLGDALKEYDLMKHLVTQGFLQFTPSLEPLALFRSHFLLFHLLYRLQDKWRSEGVGQLVIHTLEINLLPLHDNLQQTAFALTENDEIKRYYLDYQTFLTTQEQDVIDLITQFWQSFGTQPTFPTSVSEQAMTDAKHCLNITQPLTEETANLVIIQQFRKLSQKHHPDKGGDAETFHAICQAKELLLSQF